MQAAPWSSRAAAKVLQHSQTFAVRDDFVGRAPWPAADPLVGLFKHRQSRTRGSGADGGVRPTFWFRRCCSVVQTIVFRGLQTPQRWAKWCSPIVFRGLPTPRRRPSLP
jgi:hypothetical protein